MKKITGSYYPPKVFSDFIVRYLIKNKGKTTLSILEPSVGDGIFTHIERVWFYIFRLTFNFKTNGYTKFIRFQLLI